MVKLGAGWKRLFRSNEGKGSQKESEGEMLEFREVVLECILAQTPQKRRSAPSERQGGASECVDERLVRANRLEKRATVVARVLKMSQSQSSRPHEGSQDRRKKERMNEWMEPRSMAERRFASVEAGGSMGSRRVADEFGG